MDYKELEAKVNKKFLDSVATAYGDTPLATLEETTEWIGPGSASLISPLILQEYDWMHSIDDVAEVNGAILVHDYLQWVQDMKDGRPEMKPRAWLHHSAEVLIDNSSIQTKLTWLSRDGFIPQE